MVNAYLEKLNNEIKEYKLKDEYGLIHLDSGKLRVEINGKKHFINNPTYVILNPEDQIKLTSTSSSVYKIFIISRENLFSLSKHDMPTKYYDIKDFNKRFFSSTPYSDVILNLYYNRIQDYKGNTVYYDSQINAFTTTLIIHLYKEVNQIQAEKSSKLVMSEINYYMLNNYTNPGLTLESMASHFNVTPSYLSRYHKEHTGETFTLTLLRMRLSKAGELLRLGYQVQEVATLAGFSSYANFYKQFRKYYNCTPLEYIKRK